MAFVIPYQLRTQLGVRVSFAIPFGNRISCHKQCWVFFPGWHSVGFANGFAVPVFFDIGPLISLHHCMLRMALADR